MAQETKEKNPDVQNATPTQVGPSSDDLQNPDKQQPEAANPVSQRRSETPTEEAEQPSVNNRSHGDRPKVPRPSAE